jgi:hypothetical protein
MNSTWSRTGSSPISSISNVPPRAACDGAPGLRDLATHGGQWSAEQFDFDGAFLGTFAADRDEGFVTARTAGVNGSGEQFLARAVLARQEHGLIAAGGAIGQA